MFFCSGTAHTCPPQDLFFSLLNCFFGYRLRKLWNVIAGFLAGTAAGFVLCNYFGIASAPLTLLAALGCGLVCAVLAYLLYRLGLFLLCACLTIFVLFRLLNPSTAAVYGICLILGAVVGIFALLKERLTVSLATAIGGGWALRGISPGPDQKQFFFSSCYPDSELRLSGHSCAA